MYPAHSTVHNLKGAYQRQQLPVILAAAQAAEDEVKGVQDIARGLLGQGFYSNIIGGDASAYPSQAEKTLSCYGDRRDDRTKGRERRPLECFGCGGNHSWIKIKRTSALARRHQARSRGLQEVSQAGPRSCDPSDPRVASWTSRTWRLPTKSKCAKQFMRLKATPRKLA